MGIVCQVRACKYRLVWTIFCIRPPSAVHQVNCMTFHIVAIVKTRLRSAHGEAFIMIRTRNFPHQSANAKHNFQLQTFRSLSNLLTTSTHANFKRHELVFPVLIINVVYAALGIQVYKINHVSSDVLWAAPQCI